jgi:GMP synthase-like glutamine amidotransferase
MRAHAHNLLAMIRIHYLMHVPFEDLGLIERWVTVNEHTLSSTRFYEDEPLPGMGEFDWLIIMGGPMGTRDEDTYPWLVAEKMFIEQAIGHGKLVLGICLGAQLLAEVLGAMVCTNRCKEIGWFPVTFTKQAQNHWLFQVFPAEMEVFHWHGDTFSLPHGAVLVASSEVTRNQAFIWNDRVIGLQFHIEMDEEAIERIVTEGDNELLEGGPYIHSSEKIAGGMEKIKQTTPYLFRFLDILQRKFPTID